MTRPSLVDVAEAILKVQGDPECRQFKPSRVRAHLQATRRFTAAAGQLSAQCQPHLRKMRDRRWIERVHLENQKRNIPHRIVDVAALQALVAAESSDDFYDQALSSSLSGDQALSRGEERLAQTLEWIHGTIKRIEVRLAQTLERIDGTIERIEEKVPHDRTEEVGSSPETKDGEFSQSVGAETQGHFQGMMSEVYEFPVVSKFYNECDEEDRERFEKLLDWCVRTAIDHGKRPKIVGKYAGQPSGYNGCPQITFCELRADNRAEAKTRLFGAPLVATERAPLTIIIPNSHKSNQAHDEMISKGKNSFRPLALDDFFANPSRYFAGGSAPKA